MKCIVGDDVVLSRPLEGPLSSQIAGFARWVLEEGYALYSRHRQVRLAACFSRWLGQHGVRRDSVTPEHALRYLRSRARKVKICGGDPAALAQFISFLRRAGVIPPEKRRLRRPTPVEQAASEFERYLVNQRALAPTTVLYYVSFVRGFLADLFGKGPVDLSSLCARTVVRFVQQEVPRLHLKRAKLLTTALRAFLQYAQYRGDITHDLAAAVPTVANWSMTSIPRAIPPDLVRQLLASIHRKTAVGQRDYAILLLLARLGLRAGEVVRIELEDFDWKAGSMSVRRKGGQRSVLPLPADVGAAIAAYLRRGRPRNTSYRRIFLRSRAPFRGLQGAGAIASLVRHNLIRAGIETPTSGAHQFRHGLATDMLRHGASLAEIGEVLGHRSPETTRIYTKVDLNALRPLVLAWPGGIQ